MVKIKEVEKDEEVRELDDELLEEVEGGIFDEDFADIDSSAEDILEAELFDEEEPVSSFDIGTTLLTVSAPVESWAGQNLEEKISRERVEKDWGDEEDFVGSGVYHGSSEAINDVYGAKGSDAYSSGGGRGEGVYSEVSGSYDTGKGGAYDVKGSDVGALKSHDQLRDSRHGSSMLESMGFEDKKKRDHDKFARDFVAYEAKDAA